jgi:membrane protein implicated in regulation of membrane protease activity
MTIAGIRGAIAHTGAKLAEAAAVRSGVVAWLANAAAMVANQLAAAPLLVIILAIAAAIAAAAAVVVLLIKGWQALKAASPEGQLNAAKEATEGMTAAAEAANSAYQELLGTINGYKSAVSALDGMTKGTQEYTNALIEANEKAWDLISTHDLVQGQDWDYAEDGSGKIIIKDEALNNIDKTARENLENMNAGVSAAKVNEAQKEVGVAKSNVAPYLQEDLSKTYSAIGLDETGRFESLMKEWTDATNNLDDAKIEEIATEVGKKYYGEEFDFATADSSQLSKIYDMLWSGEEL